MPDQETQTSKPMALTYVNASTQTEVSIAPHADDTFKSAAKWVVLVHQYNTSDPYRKFKRPEITAKCATLAEANQEAAEQYAALYIEYRYGEVIPQRRQDFFDEEVLEKLRRCDGHGGDLGETFSCEFSRRELVVDVSVERYLSDDVRDYTGVNYGDGTDFDDGLEEDDSEDTEDGEEDDNEEGEGDDEEEEEEEEEEMEEETEVSDSGIDMNTDSD
ncbi:MAG: hypothetical protein Q9225_002204 [Loekoesia sp. 1 TL-2023]